MAPNNKLIVGGIIGRSTRVLVFCDRGISDSYCGTGWNDPNHSSQRAKVILADGKNYYDIVSFHNYIKIGTLENTALNFKS